ncbi:MAG: cobalamin biosynthesis protein, partial [Oscillospiraceae bacterium]|nr:cobalamin biosynthesis protein [Oscillospiraceae bacterium]
LNLVPKNISVGFGCKKNTDYEMFENFVLDNLKQNNIDITQLRFAATIDIKRDETAILKFCRKYSIPLKFFTAQQLMSAEGVFTASEFVKKTTGADNVCERSAAMEGGKIIVPKYSENGMTFAAAVNKTDIDFERRIF